MVIDTIANLQPTAENGRQLPIAGDGTVANYGVGVAAGVVVAGGATARFFLATKGALNATAFLLLTFSGTAPSVSLVQTMRDHATAVPGATAATLTPTSGTLAACGPATGLQGEDGCVMTITAAPGVPVTIVLAEYTAL